MKKITILLLPVLFVCINSLAFAQTDTTTYYLNLKQEEVNKAGKAVMGMTINGQIPGPTLRFTEGDYAVIYVKTRWMLKHPFTGTEFYCLTFF